MGALDPLEGQLKFVLDHKGISFGATAGCSNPSCGRELRFETLRVPHNIRSFVWAVGNHNAF